MSLESVPDLEVGVPNLESAVPSHTGEVGLELDLGLGFERRGVAEAAHPVGVVVAFARELAVGQGVP